MKQKLFAAFLLGVLTTVLVMGSIFVYLDDKDDSNDGSNEETTVDLQLDQKWYYRNEGKSMRELAFIVFESEDRLVGYNGCNDISTTYSLDGGNIEINENITTTLKLCIEDPNFSEADFMDTFQNSTKVEVENDVLTLSTDGGKQLVFYKDVNTASGLVGKWGYLKTMKGEEETLVIPDSVVSLNFEEDGKVSGEACNTFGSDYLINEGMDNLTITEVISTKKACSEPEGVMEQESEFFMNLSEAKNFTSDGTNLKIFFGENNYMEFVRAIE
jgi:heat shock protein HslJ